MSERVFAVVAGGGTAGHVLPGLAVVDALEASGHPRQTVRWLGSARGVEASIVPDAAIELLALPGRGIERRLSLASITALLSIARAVWSGVRAVRRWRPQVVLALGGYAAVPGIVGAALWRVPLVVAEQNARAGLANRLAAVVARACAVPFPETDLRKARVTGNPVRPEVLAIDVVRDRAAARTTLELPADRLVVGVFAGSLGSRHLNDCVRELAVRWADRSDLAIHHVIGARDWDELGGVPEGLVGAPLRYRPVRYEDRMDQLLAAADVVVSRAGGTTVAELSVVGVPAVLVPLPIATRDHQRANAAALVEAGAAVLVADDELSASRLDAELSPLLADRARREEMASSGRRLGRPDAAQAIAALLDEVAVP